MIALSWNLRGLGAKVKRSSLRKLIQKYSPRFVFVQETKMEDIHAKILLSIWKDPKLKWTFSPSSGNSGGLLSLWQSDFFQLDSCCCEQHWIGLTGTIQNPNFKCCLINIYNPCTTEARALVWRSITDYVSASNLPCLLMGDCNETLEPNERGSFLFSTNGSNDFKAVLQVLNLLEIQTKNGKYTWFRGNSKSKIDRLFVSPNWLAVFPSLQLNILKRSLSDHAPLLCSSSGKNWGPRPFRFLNAWLTHPGCLRNIKKAWESSPQNPITDRLKNVKSSLISWNTSEFGCIDKQISDLEDKIHDLDTVANSRTLNDDELKERRQAQADLWSWMKKKEMYWAQTSRAKWIKEGDRNTRYFHMIATMRRRRNSIEKLVVDGEETDDPHTIKLEATKFFKSIFKEEHANRPTFGNLGFKQLSQEQANTITEKFSRKEIDDAVASCDPSKAPGPDGFNFRFIKSSWEIIKEEVYNMVDDFWLTGKLPKGSNNAFIVLIPKCETPTGFSDYRPISMVGCLYKIVTKILSRRLQTVMPSIIGPHQSAFIRGRQILDGALIAGEIVDSCKRSRTKAILLKLDFHKAFDCISWNYLKWVMEQMNFPSKWIEWIISCVMTASASILLNGSPTPPFRLQRGLR